MASQPFPSQRTAPPRLHWGWVLLLSVITLNIFGVIWLMVQSNWVKQVRGRSKALPWAAAYLVVLLLDFVMALFMPVYVLQLMRIPLIVLWLVAVYTLRSELESEPIRLTLSGVMTFFFSYLYFQYFLTDYPVDRLTPGQPALETGPLAYPAPPAPQQPQL